MWSLECKHQMLTDDDERRTTADHNSSSGSGELITDDRSIQRMKKKKQTMLDTHQGVTYAGEVPEWHKLNDIPLDRVTTLILEDSIVSIQNVHLLQIKGNMFLCCIFHFNQVSFTGCRYGCNWVDSNVTETKVFLIINFKQTVKS